jgi:hypothetical protein
MHTGAAVAFVVSVGLLAQAAHAGAAADDTAATLARVGEYVQRYYARAQRIIGLETVTLQPLSSSLSPAGRARRLVYELRLEWTPTSEASPAASVVRTLHSVDGRPPRADEEPGCLDPRLVTPEPLAILLSSRQQQYAFTPAGTARVDRRPVVTFDYRPLMSEDAAEITGHGDCWMVDLPGRTYGRIWADPSTGEVLRVDEHLKGHFDFTVPPGRQRRSPDVRLTIERADSSIRYRAVTFVEPAETLLLPASIESLTVVRNSGVPRLRTTQVYSNYRRFVTDGRIVR